MWNNSRKRKELRERVEKLCVSVHAVLQDAGVDDTQLLMLTREDLQELFPGLQNFQLRRKIMEMITKAAQEPPRPSTLVNALRDLLERHDRGGPAAEGICKEYLHALKDLEKHLSAALEFLTPHIELLENLSQVSIQEEATGSQNTSSHIHSGNKGLTHAAPSSPASLLPVKIHTLVSGNTMGAHKSILTLLQPVEESNLKECRVILVFCPIATRAGTDIEAAIQKVLGTKATILVVMHHTRDQDHIGVNPRTFSPNANIVECVNVVFHESVPGFLLTCNANKQAITQIRATLQRFK